MPKRPEDYKGYTESLIIAELKYEEQLRSNNISKTETDVSDDDGSKLWVIIVAVVCSVVFIGILILVICFIRRRNRRDGMKPYPGKIEPEQKQLEEAADPNKI